MATFAIIGKSFGLLEKRIEASGDKYLYIKHSNINSGHSKKKSNTFFCDLTSYQTTKLGLEKLGIKIDGILNTYENFVIPSAWIGKVLDLPVISEQSAEACTNKYVMRTKFKAAPKKISPDFEWADSWEQVESFASTHEFPIMLKPVSLAKSLLVTKNDDLAELKKNFDIAIERGPEVYAKYSPNSEPRFIVEEFLDGPIFSVDGFADEKGNITVLDAVVDYESGYDIGMNDNFHYSRILPSRLSEDDQKAVREVAKLGMEALEMTSSPAHCELILTKEGPMLIEIGARNGGYRSRMHDMANGIDIYGIHMSVALGEPISVASNKNDGCAVLELFPEREGEFVELKNEESLKYLSSFNDLRINAKPGDKVGSSSAGFKNVARIVLHNSNLEEFYLDLDYIKENVEITVR